MPRSGVPKPYRETPPSRSANTAEDDHAGLLADLLAERFGDGNTLETERIRRRRTSPDRDPATPTGE